MDTVELTIDGYSIRVKRGTTILDAAKQLGISIPSICSHQMLSEYPDCLSPLGICRLCVVEIEGEDKLYPACSLKPQKNMNIKTNSAKVIDSRRLTAELILSRHPDADCLNCPRNGKCDIQNLAYTFQIREKNFFKINSSVPIDDKSPAIVHNPNKCILCGKCVQTCGDIQTVWAINYKDRAYHRTIKPTFDKSLNESECVTCGQCILSCPTSSFYEKENLKEVISAIRDPWQTVIAIVSPAVQSSINEELSNETSEDSNKKLVSALRICEFDKVFDSGCGADIVIQKYVDELERRLKNYKDLPAITSNCPALVKFIENFYPEFTQLLLNIKSPQQMLGSLIKTSFANKIAKDPAELYVVSITSCTARKYEANRPEMSVNKFKEIDAVLTTREIAKLIRMVSGTELNLLPNSDFDEPYNTASSNGILSYKAGGTIEGVISLLYEKMIGKKLRWKKDREEIRKEEKTKDEQSNEISLQWKKVDGIKKCGDIYETSFAIGKDTIHIAHTTGLGTARYLLEQIKSGDSKYHIIEMMACPNGCIGGGGQPFIDNMKQLEKRQNTLEIMASRHL